jgi:hypothetical protein
VDLRHTLIVTEGCQSGVNLAALGKSVGIADIFSGGDLWVLLGVCEKWVFDRGFLMVWMW